LRIVDKRIDLQRLQIKMENREYDVLCKAVLCGNANVGKSSLLRRITQNDFQQEMISTIGMDFHFRTFDLKDGRRVKMQLWDTAGQERFRGVTANNFRGAHVIFIVFDLSNRASYDDVFTTRKQSWLDLTNWHWDEAAGKFVGVTPNVVMILVGNKSDLESERKVPFKEAQERADEYDMTYVETSAKSGDNVLNAFLRIAERMYELLYTMQNEPDNSGIVTLSGERINNESTPPPPEKKCCN
jgi:small GTP-binding protein